LLNKCDIVSDKVKEEVKHTIRTLNSVAEIIETTNSNVDLAKVINTGKFDFTEAETHAKWLAQDRYDIQPESEEFGVSSFLFNPKRPFHPQKLHELLNSNFMLEIINPHDHDHDHDHEHDHDGENEEDDGEEDEEDEDDETDEQYQARLAEAKLKFKKDRAEGQTKKEQGMFKHLFRSKGFIWLANRPNLFFEWSQAAQNLNINVGGPWVCTLKEKSLEDQCKDKDFGDRSQNLIFIGQAMGKYREIIIEAIEKCLVTDDEWESMMSTKMTLHIEEDPFKDSVPDDDKVEEEPTEEKAK
jgi:G3E family GTPase